jgi:hypothetical protein
MAKLHDLLARLYIDSINVILRVMVVHNEEGMFELREALTCQYQPHKVLLDFNVQPLMLGKAVVDGLGLTNVDFDPCPYQIFASMGGSKKVRRLTKYEIVVHVNPNKPTNYTTMQAQIVVMHVTSYDVLVGGVVLYPLRVTIYF